MCQYRMLFLRIWICSRRIFYLGWDSVQRGCFVASRRESRRCWPAQSLIDSVRHPRSCARNRWWWLWHFHYHVRRYYAVSILVWTDVNVKPGKSMGHPPTQRVPYSCRQRHKLEKGGDAGKRAGHPPTQHSWQHSCHSTLDSASAAEHRIVLRLSLIACDSHLTY